MKAKLTLRDSDDSIDDSEQGIDIEMSSAYEPVPPGDTDPGRPRRQQNLIPDTPGPPPPMWSPPEAVQSAPSMFYLITIQYARLKSSCRHQRDGDLHSGERSQRSRVATCRIA